MQVLRSHFDLEGIARRTKVKSAKADSFMEKRKRCAARIPAAIARTGGISGSLK
jgi:hypothetical protein